MEDRKKIINHFTKTHFGIDLYPTQAEIVNKILDEDVKRLTIITPTRYGKTFVLGASAIMLATLIPNNSIGLLAPTHDKSRKIMNYVTDMLANSKGMADIVDIDLMGLSKLDKLKAEVSKKKITFKNNSYIEIKSADVKGRGFSLMGMGYKCTIIDESAEVTPEVFAKIYRMLLEDPNAKIVEIGNPWYLNHFYNHQFDKDWTKIRISWKDAVREGRFTQEQVDDQRKELTPLEFRVLLDAEFPEDVQNSVFSLEGHIRKAQDDVEIKLEDIEKFHMGLDVGRGGDLSVLTILGEKEGEYYFLQGEINKQNDLMKVVGWASEIIEIYPKNKCTIKIDTVGLGSGVYDRLKELGYPVKQFIAGAKAHNKSYFNFKAETVFGLAKIMYESRLHNLPRAGAYELQLRQWTYEIRSDRQKRVIDPEPSPNYSDSLAIAISEPRGGTISFFSKGLSLPS